MFSIRGLLTLSLALGLSSAALAAPVPGRAINRRLANQTFRGTIVSMRSLPGPGQNGSVTIRIHRRNLGRGRSARAALGRAGARGGVHTFGITGATLIERNGRGRLPFRSLRRGEYVLVAASGGTARVVDVLGWGGGRRLHPLVRSNWRYHRNGLVRRAPRFVRGQVYYRPFHPLVHRRVIRYNQVRRPTVVRPKAAPQRPPLHKSVTAVHKQAIKHPPRPVIRKATRPPVKHALTKPVKKPRPAHASGHSKGGRKR
jgi:hypothetical protein